MKKMLIFTEPIFAYISKDQKKRLREFARIKLVSMNDVVRDAIEEYLQNHPIKSEELQNSV